jgi:hypothetical protein
LESDIYQSAPWKQKVKYTRPGQLPVSLPGNPLENLQAHLLRHSLIASRRVLVFLLQRPATPCGIRAASLHSDTHLASGFHCSSHPAQYHSIDFDQITGDDRSVDLRLLSSPSGEFVHGSTFAHTDGQPAVPFR